MTTPQCSNCFFGQTVQTIRGSTLRVCRQPRPSAINSDAVAEWPLAYPLTPEQAVGTALWQPVRDDDWCGDGADAVSGVSYSSLVNQLPGPGQSGFGTGDGKITFKTVADSGWLLCDDGTFGSPLSGSNNRANIDTQALFDLFFATFADADAPLLTSIGGATTRAAQGSTGAAWAANCRMTLTRQLGRSIAIAGSGAGLTPRVLGHYDGNETHTQATGEVGQHDHAPVSGGNIAADNAGSLLGYLGPPGGAAIYEDTLAETPPPSPMDIMNPRSYWNVMVKL